MQPLCRTAKPPVWTRGFAICCLNSLRPQDTPAEVCRNHINRRDVQAPDRGVAQNRSGRPGGRRRGFRVVPPMVIGSGPHHARRSAGSTPFGLGGAPVARSSSQPRWTRTRDDHRSLANMRWTRPCAERAACRLMYRVAPIGARPRHIAPLAVLGGITVEAPGGGAPRSAPRASSQPMSYVPSHDQRHVLAAHVGDRWRAWAFEKSSHCFACRPTSSGTDSPSMSGARRDRSHADEHRPYAVLRHRQVTHSGTCRLRSKFGGAEPDQHFAQCRPRLARSDLVRFASVTPDRWFEARAMVSPAIHLQGRFRAATSWRGPGAGDPVLLRGPDGRSESVNRSRASC